LGMGGGFYDRTLQNWQQHKIQPVGYAHDCQLVEKLPVDIAKQYGVSTATISCIVNNKSWVID
ncbi:hypothetical protein MJI00_23575, partial [Salmonella enterica subsp. enterica serovar Kentucky]|nr:hypothetical protein [Salmonella enterica subsp. enterica serovar Kentucky]